MNLNIGLYKQQHNSLENEAITGLMISRSSIFSHLQCGFSLALSLLDRFRACHVLKVERPKPDNFAKSLQIKRHTQYYLNLSLGCSVERDNSRKRLSALWVELMLQNLMAQTDSIFMCDTKAFLVQLKMLKMPKTCNVLK